MDPVFADETPPFRLGRNRSKPALVNASPQFRRRAVATYLPSPPVATDYSAMAMPSLKNVYLNDREGCCVVSGGMHTQGVLTGNAGLIKLFTDAEVNHDYGKIGGYDGTPQSDNGCDMQTALRYWKAVGFPGGNKLEGWLAVGAQDIEGCKLAVHLFENLFIAMEMPSAYVNPFPSRDGFVWDVAGGPDRRNGHCVIAYGYNETGLLISTWGLLGTLTWGAVRKYVTASAGGELYVMLDDAIINRARQRAPNGYDWPALVQDFNELGGAVPVPTPPAPPVPPSPPPNPPSPPAPPPFDFWKWLLELLIKVLGGIDVGKELTAAVSAIDWAQVLLALKSPTALVIYKALASVMLANQPALYALVVRLLDALAASDKAAIDAAVEDIKRHTALSA